jgi:hypothetical protein
MKKYFLLAAIVWPVLFGCHTTPRRLPQPITVPKVSVCGLWKLNGFMYGDRLLLRNDGSFQYTSHCCTGDTYTEGSWVLHDYDIVLNSFDRYKEDNRFTVIRKGPGRQLTVVINSSDTVNVYFNQVRFRWYGNYLCKLDSNGVYANEKYEASHGDL